MTAPPAREPAPNAASTATKMLALQLAAGTSAIKAPAAVAAACTPLTQVSLRRVNSSWKPGRLIRRRVVTPAATASGLPDNVPA